MITALLTFYVLFVVIRDGQCVAYKLWAAYHNCIYKPYVRRRGYLVQYAANACPPFKWMDQTR